MRVAMVHQFHGVTRKRFIDLFFDIEVNRWFRDGLELGEYTVESLSEADGEIRRVTWTCIPDEIVPHALARVAGSRRLMLREETRHRIGSSVIRFMVRPNVLRHRVKAKGIIELEELDDRGLRRSITGRIEVDVPLIGELIAELVRDNLETVNRLIAGRMQQWIDEHPE